MLATLPEYYRLTGQLGAGGMGEVYRALDTRLDREVAIKLLPEEFATDITRLHRFEREAKTLAALNHPNILSIFDAGVRDGQPYLVSELLEGRTLRELLSHARLPHRKAIEHALLIAHGLAAAHAKGIIHRDLKPENIFIARDDRVKILDFGLAKFRATPGEESLRSSETNASTDVETTQRGMVLGTPSYMSPEQVRGEAVDHRSDVFSFGCILYEMLTGQRAFRGQSVVQTMNAILEEEPAEFPETAQSAPALERIVRRCLEK